MPSFLAYHIGLMSHLGSTFSKNVAVRWGAGILTFFDFSKMFQNVLKRVLGALGALGKPWGPYFPLFSPIFPPFSPPLGAPYFSF